MYPTPLHERLASVVGQRSSRHIGDLTGTNHETVRRYIAGYAPSVEFLQSLCKAFGVSGEWMLTGKGPMKAADIRATALREADPGELLTAMATSVETLISRVDRLELFLQTMETRLRALGTLQSPEPTSAQETFDGQVGRRSPSTTDGSGQSQATDPPALAPNPPATPTAPAIAQSPVVAIPKRVLRLRDAFPQRPHEDAR